MLISLDLLGTEKLDTELTMTRGGAQSSGMKGVIMSYKCHYVRLHYVFTLNTRLCYHTQRRVTLYMSACNYYPTQRGVIIYISVCDCCSLQCGVIFFIFQHGIITSNNVE